MNVDERINQLCDKVSHTSELEALAKMKFAAIIAGGITEGCRLIADAIKSLKRVDDEMRA